MSNIYHTEPPTCGKVVLTTSYGEMDIELWSKEAPYACRNFVQLCMEGYYDNTPIHRIIKQFMVQMGDPTGTGEGGESIWGKPFKDEIHGRIKFNHRGQVAMANENVPNSNHSQFFITLDSCEWLNRKHTIFGKVTGNTVFNLMRMGEAETDSSSDKPLEPILITKAEVLWNPFDDIIPRDIVKTSSVQDKSKDEKKEKKSNRKGTKNLKLLSFGEEEEGDTGEQALEVRICSKHDSKIKDPKLSSEVSEELLEDLDKSHDKYQVLDKPQDSSDRRSDKDRKKSKESSHTHSAHHNAQQHNTTLSPTMGGAEDVDNFEAEMIKKLMKKRKAMSDRGRATDAVSTQADAEEMLDQAQMEEVIEVDSKVSSDSLVENKKREFRQIRDDLMKSKRAVKVLHGSELQKTKDDFAQNSTLTALEGRRQMFKKKKMQIGERQEMVLAKLSSFQNKLRSEKEKVVVIEKKETEAYHGQILEDDDKDDGAGDKDWHVGKLKFRKHIDDNYRMGGDGRNVDDYVLVDARLTK